MDSASQARIERVNGAQKLKRAFRIRYRRLKERGFVCAALAVGIARARIPRGGHHRLVILDRLVFDLHPVPQRPARGLEEAESSRRFGPRVRVPLFPVVNPQISRRQVVSQLLDPSHQAIREELRFECARRDTAKS